MDKSSHFDQLLRAAAAELEPQRLLFVFATAELPEDATRAQRQRFESGGGGTLEPVMCVDKGLDDLTSFEELIAESSEAGLPWRVAFAAGLSGRNGQSPSAEQVEQALQKMVAQVRSGMIEGLLALDASGNALHFV